MMLVNNKKEENNMSFDTKLDEVMARFQEATLALKRAYAEQEYLEEDEIEIVVRPNNTITIIPVTDSKSVGMVYAYTDYIPEKE